jgi:hypothetical protein
VEGLEEQGSGTMSVAEIGHLHSRFVRLSDRFKAAWTYHQFASGIYKNFFSETLAIAFDFQKLFESIRRSGDAIQNSSPVGALPMMAECDRQLFLAFEQLIAADGRIGPSVLRRFFEKLRRQDEKIIFNLIKFYLYVGSTEGEQRDKLDFLFTRVGEELIEERAEYTVRDQVELRKHLYGLTAAAPAPQILPADAAAHAARFRELRDEILSAASFEQLTDSAVVARARQLKHEIGDAYLHPEVLLAVIECNIAAKNRFARLYRDEEERIMEGSRRLIENEHAIAHDFGESNPALLNEIRRFKRFKQEFDDSRTRSNVKASVISQLKASMDTILSQLDDRLTPDAEVEELSGNLFLDPLQLDAVQSRFGDDPLLQPYLLRIVSVIESYDAETNGPITSSPEMAALRLEPWEITAIEKLYHERERAAGENDELLLLYLRAAALRLKIDEEARELAACQFSAEEPPRFLLDKVRATLDRGKEFDEFFKELLQDLLHANPNRLHRIYRSRMRLLRSFSGLWLLYDHFAQDD